ncbi:MAG: transporter substrate-binding protein [Pseudonocardia sp.]|uniref:ABC transporter substrate-binding protein n=1 Tax=Pseudonocardia sp. TaxID=60912 RepID=UPI00261CE4B5|nr:ABC transporter substrate-binding protein [Pseudonocardia sp.]MCU1628199.1 transporter substrate-binding protein [Pseudonocardia sp.]
MKLTRLWVLAVALVAALLAGCANRGTSPTGGASGGTSGPLKIGVIVPLSGPAGPNGQDVLDAVQVQAHLVNAAGGVQGRQLEIVAKDDQSNPANGVSAATELAGGGVAVVMGGWNSPVTLAIQPVLVRSGILNITTIPQNATILGGADPDAVRLNAGNGVGAYVAGQYLTTRLGAKSVGLLLENDAYGNDIGKLLAEQLQPAGVTVASQQAFDYAATDFRVPLSNIQGAAPNAVFSANAAESSGMPALAQQYARSGIGAPHLAALGTVSPKVVELAGGAAVDGLYSADIYFPDVAPFTGYAENQRFAQAFAQKTGNPPDKYAALGAQSVDVWAKAVQKAGTTDRAAVADAIHGQTFTGTVMGDVRFTDKGQMETKVYAFTVEGGKIKVLDEIPVPDEVWNR